MLHYGSYLQYNIVFGKPQNALHLDKFLATSSNPLDSFILCTYELLFPFLFSQFVQHIHWCVALQLAVEESKSFRERSMTLVLVPNKAVVQKAPESPKKKEKTASEVSAGV